MMPGRLRAHRALIALSLVGVANALDRHVIGIVLPQIRSEFHLGDALLGLLSGPAFAITYATCGVPLALLADRVGRRRVIAGALAFFSTATLACGLAGSFWQLAWARLATGLGEAGTTSPCVAYIADHYPEDRRNAPLSVFAASGNTGLLLAFIGGGWIAEHEGWRAVFLASAAFGGVVLVALALLIPGPPLQPQSKHPGVRAMLGPLRDPVVLWIVAGAAIASIGGYAGSAFVPSFLARSHHMSPSMIGLTLATLAGTVGWAGTAFPGLAAQRWESSDRGFALKLASLSLLLALPFHAVFYLVADLRLTVLAAIPLFFVSAIFLGPSFAAVQQVAPRAGRAQAASLLLLAINLVGLSLGPPLVGIVSHLLQPSLGQSALRCALAIVTTAPVIPAAFCLWSAAKALQRLPAAQ